MTDASGKREEGPRSAGSSAAEGVDVLFREHARFVATFLVRLGASAQDIDDLVQEVFLVAHRLGGSRSDAAKPTTWLAAIALRVLSHDRRSRRRHPEVPDEVNVSSAVADAPSQEDVVRATESLTIVGRALQALDIEKRALFILFEIEEHSCESIAAGLGIPVVTVYSPVPFGSGLCADASYVASSTSVDVLSVASVDRYTRSRHRPGAGVVPVFFTVHDSPTDCPSVTVVALADAAVTCRSGDTIASGSTITLFDRSSSPCCCPYVRVSSTTKIRYRCPVPYAGIVSST